MRQTLLLAASLLALLTTPVGHAQQTVPARPRLVLVLAIDQMRFDYLTRFDRLFTGGFRRLLDRGALFTNAKYQHAGTETGPGHSVILTDRHPSHSGIIANEWFDGYLGKLVNVVEDPIQRPVGGTGRKASPANAIGFTIGDVLKENDPQARVVSVSLKDRSAILLGGRRADAAYWYETSGGNFITSSYYMDEPPSWLVAVNDRHMADGYAGQMWTRLNPDASVYERYAGKDAVEGEWDRIDTVFPHRIRGNPPETLFYDDLRRTPFADDMTLTVAFEAMKSHHLGDDAVTDILAIGFSATDVVGHTYGSDSQEVMDQLLRLDLTLDKLFTQVDATVGLANTLIVLTADHGGMPLVENLTAKGFDAKRANPAVLQEAVEQALAKQFPGEASLVRFFLAPDFYLDLDGIRTRGLDRKEVESTAIQALLATGLVAKVYTTADLLGDAPASDPYFTLFKNGFYEPRSPQLTVLLKPNIYLNSSYQGGTGHGSAYDYDRHVPIVFMGGGVKPGRYEAPSAPEDIAPTLAHILGLEFPHEPDSRLLREMLP